MPTLDHTWTRFKNKKELLSYGVGAGEFKSKVHSYVGRFMSQKGLNPGRIQVSPSSVDFFLTSSGKVKKLNAEFEFLRRNKNFTYAWVKASSQKCLNTAVTVDDKWMIGRTSIGDSSYLGKVRVGSLGMLYEDHFGREILTDDYEILTCNANPLKRLVEDTKTENFNLKKEVEALNQKLMEKSRKIASYENSETILRREIQKLTSENENFKAGKEMLVTSINNLKSEVDMLKENAVKVENDHKNEIKMHNFEKDSLKRQVEEKTEENQGMRSTLDECEDKKVNLTEEIDDLNLRIANAAKDHNAELENLSRDHKLVIEKLETKIHNLEQKSEASNPDSEVSENCEHNLESDQLGIEFKIFNYFMIELKYFVGFKSKVSFDNSAKEILTKLNSLFENEISIDCSIDDQTCEVNSWVNRHFNTKIVGISTTNEGKE